MGNEKLEAIQQSTYGQTGQDRTLEQLKNWGNRHQERLTEEPGLWNSLIRWPMDKFTDYRTDRMLKHSPEQIEAKNQLLKSVEAMYQDKTIDANEAKSDDYYRWKALLRGEGIK